MKNSLFKIFIVFLGLVSTNQLFPMEGPKEVSETEETIRFINDSDDADLQLMQKSEVKILEHAKAEQDLIEELIEKIKDLISDKKIEIDALLEEIQQLKAKFISQDLDEEQITLTKRLIELLEEKVLDIKKEIIADLEEIEQQKLELQMLENSISQHSINLKMLRDALYKRALHTLKDIF